MDAASEILKIHAHPLSRTLQPDVDRGREAAVARQEPTMMDGLKRSIRKLLGNLLTENDKGNDTFDEISTFAIWKRYGPKLKTGIDTYGVVVIHVETTYNDRPSVVFLGTLDGKTLAFHLPDDGGKSPWDNFRRAFPQLAATLDHGQLIKVTTTYKATTQLFSSDDGKYTHENCRHRLVAGGPAAERVSGHHWRKICGPGTNSWTCYDLVSFRRTPWASFGGPVGRRLRERRRVSGPPRVQQDVAVEEHVVRPRIEPASTRVRSAIDKSNWNRNGAIRHEKRQWQMSERNGKGNGARELFGV